MHCFCPDCGGLTDMVFPARPDRPAGGKFRSSRTVPLEFRNLCRASDRLGHVGRGTDPVRQSLHGTRIDCQYAPAIESVGRKPRDIVAFQSVAATSTCFDVSARLRWCERREYRWLCQESLKSILISHPFPAAIWSDAQLAASSRLADASDMLALASDLWLSKRSIKSVVPASKVL